MSGEIVTDEQCLWAYAITADGPGIESLPQQAGVGGNSVRAAAAAGLTALVSDVSRSEFGPAALRMNLEDPAWLEAVARAHHNVVDAAAGLFPVVPLRLATVYSDEAALTAGLAERHADLHAALRRVGGRVEWGVKAYAAAAGADTRQAADAGTDAGGGGTDAGGAGTDAGGAGTAGAGTAYLKRRRAELSARRDSQRTATASAQTVHAELSEHAEQARLYPPQAPALSGSRVPMLLNAAYLLDAGSAEVFTAAVAAAAGAHPGLRLELTGPWPPYSFAGEDT